MQKLKPRMLRELSVTLKAKRPTQRVGVQLQVVKHHMPRVFQMQKARTATLRAAIQMLLACTRMLKVGLLLLTAKLHTLRVQVRMPSPKLAIMDEVTSGLDVINAFEIREIIREIARSGVTVVMSSHNMFEVDMLCDRVGVIDGGNLILLGTPGELKEQYGADTLEEVFVKAVKNA